MKFVAYERGAQRTVFRYLAVSASAVVWRYSRKKDDGCSSTASTGRWCDALETKSFVAVQRSYRRLYGDNAPDTETIKSWFDKFLAAESGGTCRSATEEKVEEIRTALQKCPSESIRQAQRELRVPRTSVHLVLERRLHLFAYKVQITQELKPNKSQSF
jgi:hypothetical protein